MIPGLSAIEISTLMLLFARVGGIFTTAPVLGSSRVPIPVKAGLAFLLAAVLLPVTTTSPAAAPESLLPFAGVIIKELTVGLTIGFVANMLVSTLQMAGELADLQAGFGFASLVDPTFGGRSSIMSHFQGLLAWVIFLGINGHHMLMSAVAASVRAVPLGLAGLGPSGAHSVVELSAHLFPIVLQVAAPVTGAVLLADIALGMIARTMPQMNILVLGFPMKMALALVTIVLALPLYPSIGRHVMTVVFDSVDTLIRMMVP
jgi:flagellar biosynthetic protein FliR